MDGHPETPTPLRFERQGVGLKRKMDANWLRLGPGYREAKLAEILGGVDKRIAFRNRENAMHVGLLLKQFGDIAQRDLGLRMLRPHGGGGHHIDRRGELVVNPVG